MIVCKNCGPKIGKFCNDCGKELENIIFTETTIGTWEVSTENDEDGKTMKSLGTHYGSIREVALDLRNAVFYRLYFKLVGRKIYKEHGDILINIIGSNSLTIKY
jgi:hypothetical protein